MQTNKLEELVKTNVYANMQQKAKQTADLLKSNLGKEAINKTIQAAKNSEIITKARNTLNPTNMKAASTKLYADVVKAPIAKTQDWMKKKKEHVLDVPIPNLGPIPLGPSLNMTVRDGIDAAKDSFSKIVGDKDGGSNNEVRSNIDFLLKKSTCTVEELIAYLNKIDGYNRSNYANEFITLGKWPEDLQIPKNSSVLNSDSSIDWAGVPKGGYVIDKNGNPIKEEIVPKIGDIIDRYGPPNGRYTSPVVDGRPFDYEERSLPYVEDLTKYHLKVQEGEIARGFGSDGGGIQYELPLPINFLEELRLLKEVKSID